MNLTRRTFVTGAGAVLSLAATRPAIGCTGRSPAMLARPIPSTGELLPAVGFGNSAAFRNGNQMLTDQLLNTLLEKGGSFIDVAGASQRPIGAYMARHDAHDRLFLGTNIAAADRQAGRGYIDSARTVQGKDPLDLLQVNRLGELKAQWKNLRDWKEAGLTRYIGIATIHRSAYPELEALLKTGTMDFLQINYSLLETASSERLLPVAADMGVAVVTNRPFVNGRYFPLIADRELPAWAAEFDCHSWAQFSLKFILGHPAVNSVLTETTKPRHALDNLSAGFGRLPDKKTRQRMLQLVSQWH